VNESKQFSEVALVALVQSRPLERSCTAKALEYSRCDQSIQQPLQVWLDLQNGEACLTDDAENRSYTCIRSDTSLFPVFPDELLHADTSWLKKQDVHGMSV
jgi:hypothetical protein